MLCLPRCTLSYVCVGLCSALCSSGVDGPLGGRQRAAGCRGATAARRLRPVRSARALTLAGRDGRAAAKQSVNVHAWRSRNKIGTSPRTTLVAIRGLQAATERICPLSANNAMQYKGCRAHPMYHRQHDRRRGDVAVVVRSLPSELQVQPPSRTLPERVPT